MVKLWVIRIAFVCAFLALVGNLYMLQVGEQNYYAQQAHARYSNAHTSEVDRGSIYFTDKYGTNIPAVLNKEYPVVFAVPDEIESPAHAAQLLAPILERDQEELVTMLSKTPDQYELLLEKATSQQVKEVRDLELSGIYVVRDTFRFYPFTTMAAPLLGFVAPAQDNTIQGRYGVERAFDQQLAQGKDTDVVLTIDRNIQAEAEKIISNLQEVWSADSASMLVQRPSTGDILAMAHTPSFNPNTYREYALKDFINPLVQEVYEPGSVFKVFTVAAGLDSGAVSPHTTYYDSGEVTLNGRTIHNWDLKSHGTQTIANVLEKSLNTGSVFAEQQTGHGTFTEYVERFGFGDVSGIQLPGEVPGDITNLYGGRDINYATASFGQGISATPIQLISAFSAIANGGVLYEPNIVANQNPSIVRRVVKKESAEALSEILVSAVDKNVVAHIPQYKVAAKTGTANVPDLVYGGYSDDVINTYIGFAPATNPIFTVLVRLEKPQGAPLAGQTVVPAFKEMVEFLLNYYEVAPDRPTS